MENFDFDTYHEQLQATIAKRATAIRDEGEDFRVVGSDRHVRGGLDQKGEHGMFDAAGQLQVGQILEAKNGGQYCVLATKSLPGCIFADVAGVVGNATVLQKTVAHTGQGAVVRLTQTAQALPILKHEGGILTAQLRYGSLVGSVLRVAGKDLEVVGATIRGGVVDLRVNPYREPSTKTLSRPQAPPRWVSDPPQPDSWHSSNVR